MAVIIYEEASDRLGVEGKKEGKKKGDSNGKEVKLGKLQKEKKLLRKNWIQAHKEEKEGLQILSQIINNSLS